MTTDPTSLLDCFSIDDGLPDPLPADPFGLFEQWYNEARDQRVQPNPGAFTLATADDQGRPSARMVLCKKLETDTGSVVFHTNAKSRKGREMARGWAAAVFHWDTLERQIRLEGPVTPVSSEESDAYFRTRSWERRVGAWASQQSEPLASREALFEQIAETIVELDLDLGALMRGEDVEIPRPPHWGGFRLTAQRVELWLGGSGRIHDRAEWTRTDTGPWSSTRLQP